MTYNTKIVRSKRKTLSISVSAQNQIIVRCPYCISDSKVEKFISSKRTWLENIINKNEIALSENDGILKYHEIFVSGNRVPLTISTVKAITNDAVYVKKLSDIKELYIDTFSDDVITYVRNMAQKLELSVNAIRIKSYKSRWGCCDRNNNITLNYLLFMLPFALQRYVILHELCHTKYFDHSHSFWDFLKNVEPDYKSLREQLKNYSFIIGLY